MAALEHILLAYVAAWNEADEAKRRTLLETSWTEQGIYSDPTADEHHGLLQFTWARVGSDGSLIRTGIDFGQVAADGRLLRITGFFGPPPPIPLTFPADQVLQEAPPV